MIGLLKCIFGKHRYIDKWGPAGFKHWECYHCGKIKDGKKS